MTAAPWISVDLIAGHLSVPRDSINRWIDRKGLSAFRLLESVPELSCGSNQGKDSGNLIVQGDNLHAIKALLPRCAGPKVIYAAANSMGARAARVGITFKQTPYALGV